MESREWVKRGLLQSVIDGSSNYPTNFKTEIMAGPSTPVNSTVWSQVTPSSMSWGTAYGNLPQVVRFSGRDCNSTFPFGSPSDRMRLGSESKTRTWFAKRKGLFENEMIPPPKLLITEEHMANQLQSMHISNMYTSHNSVDDCTTFNENSSSRLLELPEESGTNRQISFGESIDHMPSLVLCDELRQLQKTPNILPPSLVAKLESPSKALVLWKPPGPALPNSFSGRGINTEKQLLDITNNNNNNKKEEEENSENNCHVDESSSSLSCCFNDLSPTNLIGGMSASHGLFCSSSNDVEDMSVDV